MHLPSLLLALSSAALTLSSTTPQHPLFSNPEPSTATIPSVHESAILARRLLRLSNMATLSTVYPSGSDPSLSNVPIGLPDYYADCLPSADPIVLAIDIATTFRNAAAGSNVSLSVSWTAPAPTADDPVPRSAASLPRFALLGELVPIPEDDWSTAWKLRSCYLLAHPDAVTWLPGNRIHASHWVRLEVKQVYWVGGFGDRAYIGWIPVEEWKSVTEQEIKEHRLPGETQDSVAAGREKDSWWW